ncbi:MAG: glycosyltransferase [Candidatus Omnitrophota bacterium]
MRFSVIIPVFNRLKSVTRCLDMIMSQARSDIEVIIIDNGSSDDTARVIPETYPGLVFIHNNMNMGASFARNQGIRAAKGEYLIFVDSDAYPDRDFFSALDNILADLPGDIAAIAPKILRQNDGCIFSCGLRMSPILRVFDVGRGRPGRECARPFEVDGPNSCAAVIKKECLEAIRENGQYFDETFFFLFEDVDMALRLKAAGFRTVFRPELIFYHSGDGSFSSQRRRYLCFRNRWYLILKRYRGKGLAAFLMRSFFYDFARTAHFALTNRYFFKAAKDILARAQEAGA